MPISTPPPDPEESVVAKSHLSFPVVGIGASAGGVDALQRLLAPVPRDCGMAFVVVMHLSPDHESLLAPILARAGQLHVLAVTEVTPIQANHVYVISPAMKLAMSDGHLRVSKLSTLEGRRQSIDMFFRSLAQAHQERAVCVVLSGTGSDGAQGLKRIKELGGVAIAQSIEDAEFDGMPRAAIQTGVVDFVLPVAEMAGKLQVLWENARRIELPSPPVGLEVETSTGEADMQAEEALLSIKALLRERTGHDFAHYKRGTVLRRLERRMQVNAVPDLPSYRRLLDSEPRETLALLQDMLISVTNFFRDPEAFAALESALKATFVERAKNEPFRAWVAGCATGEEAYSIAILLWQAAGPGGPPIQVFASDIDQRAVAAARTGLFPASIAADVSAERLRDFFMPEAGGFRIAKNVRDSVIFSAHNVLSDPPFTRMDMICCRNLMIYLDRAAQEQLLRSFHFALKPRGVLFLGGSETTDAAGDLFDGIDKSHRIYRANFVAGRSRVFPPLPMRTPSIEIPAEGKPTVEVARPPLEVLHERVLRHYAPPTVLVDADDTVLHLSERVSHLLRFPEGAPTNKLMALARPELRAELRAALARAAQTGKTVEAARVQLSINGENRIVTMTVRPATHETPPGLMLVIFDEAEESMAPLPAHAGARDPVVESLESELLRTQERLRSTVGESAASTEELRASNEELQTINEELRSTTEELETSREELQAVNEELTTVNTELVVRIEETSKISDDLQNLMTSADIGTIFVDRELQVKRFTPQSATLFNLLPADLGRPLLDITHRLDYPQLKNDLNDVLRDLRRIEHEVQSEDGRRFMVRVVPYRTTEDRIDGAVLAFFDVTSRHAAEERLRETETRMTMVAASMRDYAIITMDPHGLVTTWSTGAQRIFGYEADEVVGKSFDLLFTPDDRLAGQPQEEMARARATGRATDDRWYLRKDGVRIFCSGATTPLGDEQNLGFAKIARDFTEIELRDAARVADLAAERATSGRLQEASAMKDEFLAVVSHELKNPLAVIQMHAQLLSRMLGASTEARTLRSTQAILSAVSSQAQIINDLLELSRVNVGKVVLAPVGANLADIVRGVLDVAAHDAEAKGQTLRVELTEASVFVDTVRVEQIVWNLIGNAVKFTPDGGEIAIRLVQQTSAVALSVQDSGIGIDPAQLPYVFDMFRQVDAGASRFKPGLGIGLALVKQLTELHGGQVSAESEGLGHGARFTVWLPLAGETAGHLPGQVAARGFGGLNLLIVDDEEDLVSVFGALLESEGATVVFAQTAEQAIELVRAGNFDGVVSDIAMPGKDGYWLAEQLRGDPATQNIPLIAVSGMARNVDRLRATEAGFDAHLGKPLDIELLKTRMLEAIGKHAAG